jgi:hypothetical protein
VTKTDAIAASERRALSSLTPPRVAVGAVGVATAAIFVARTFTWPSASSNDAWAYAAWGQALARGEQLVYNTATTPKPLATVLAAIVSPLPPNRAWALVVALALGVLVAALLAAGYREAGVLGGVVAVGAFVFAAPLERVIWTSLVDAVTAALVVLAIALRGRARVASLVLAGLLRPEAWVLSALAGYVESAGSRLRRLLLGIGAGVVPLLLWTAFDLAVTGDPRASRRFQETGELLDQGPREALGLFRAAVTESGALFALIGGVGLLAHAWRKRRGGEFPFPLAVGFLWSASLLAETVYGFELNVRYLFPLVAVLALGWGLLIGGFAPPVRGRQTVLVWAAAAVVVAVTGLAVLRMDFGRGAQRPERVNQALEQSLPAIEPILDCGGDVGLVGRRHVGSTIARLAAGTQTSLTRFEPVEPGQASRYTAILAVNGSQADRLPAWPVRETSIGLLAVNPRCAG